MEEVTTRAEWSNRIVTVIDESGTEEFCYGPLGETVKTIKTVASETQGNSKNSPEIYTTLFEFDTFNRLQKLTYPDGELLVNHYDSGGLLRQITGAKDKRDYKYVDRLEYGKFDQRAFVKFGNSVISKYTYNPLNRRLANLDSRTKGKESQFQDLVYDYDNVGNILGQANRAAIKSPSQMGGATRHQYVYDDLYRLVHANGTFDTQPDKQHRYTFDMQYDSIHNILNKNQHHDLVQPSQQTLVQAKTTYDWSYEYKGTQPHAPTHIGLRTFTYDANGNQTGWTHDENGTWRQIVWDEENRIQQIIDNNHIFDYKYNHAGERVIKTGPQGETVYVNQFFVIRGGSVASKHIFAGTTRMVTKLAMQENTSVSGMNTLAVNQANGATTMKSLPTSPRHLFRVLKKPGELPESSNKGGSSADAPGTVKNDPNSCDKGVGHAHCPTPEPTPSEPEVTPPAPDTPTTDTPAVPDGTGTTTTTPSVESGTETPVIEGTPADKPTGKPVDNTNPPASSGDNPPTTDKPKPDNGKGPAEHQLYFYHPDHLGSSAYITDSKGGIYQHLEYFAFGETWVDESSNVQRTPFHFTAKEEDEETGLYYFGARYYDARTSLWLSVDPLWFKYPSWSPYNYAFHKPLIVIDPDGREGIVISGGDVDSNYKMQPATRKLETGLMNAKKLQKQYNKEGQGEQVTWFVPKGTDKTYAEKAKKAGIQVKYFSNSKDITTYVNEKNGKDSRSKDTISDLKYYGHGGKDGILYPADQVGKDFKLDVDAFKPSAFDKDAELFFAACNSFTVASKATDLTKGTIVGFNTKIRIYSNGLIVPDTNGGKEKIPGIR